MASVLVMALHVFNFPSIDLDTCPNTSQILFFTDRPTIQSMQQKFALYADKFPTWATQSDGESLDRLEKDTN